MLSLRSRVSWRCRLPFVVARDLLGVYIGRLPVRLKMRVAVGTVELACRRLLPNANGAAICRVAGFRVRTGSLNTLDLLHREIFVHLDYYVPLTNSSPNILDCGSNIGLSILFFKSLYPAATVVGFEPAPGTYALLRENIDANGLADVAVYNSAVGATDGDVALFFGNESGSPTASTHEARHDAGRVMVRQERLSRYVDREVDLLKMDIEGAELAVLRELVASGVVRRVGRMIIEYHHHNDAECDELGEFLRCLEREQFGYQIAAVADRRRVPGQFQDMLIFVYYRKDS